jgi:hypothetical protein
MHNELTKKGNLLDVSGGLTQIGWSRQPLLDCNLENVNFYSVRALQRFRIKRWDYYALFTPQRFFSATIADLGYAGNIFVYIYDYATGELHEEGLVVPLGKGVALARNSDLGVSSFKDKHANLRFEVIPEGRHIFVTWQGFNAGRGISAEVFFRQSAGHESMTIVIPIGRHRFYYNRKINCLAAEGQLQYGDAVEHLTPDSCTGSLDWGRGVWEYNSFWNWASASGFLPDGQTVGFNFGCGFGDLSAATENCLIVNERIHKLNLVYFNYDPHDFMHPWKFTDSDHRLSLDFVPVKERVAKTNLGIIFSEVHQMLGKYSGSVQTDEGSILKINNLNGFAEEHHARW